MNFKPLIGVGVFVLLVWGGSVLLGRAAGQLERNLETSPDWDEAWELLQKAWAYHLKGDKFHVNLRIKEALHHADKLPMAQRAVLHQEIRKLEQEAY